MPHTTITWSSHVHNTSFLQLLHGGDISGLDVVLELLNLVLKVRNRDLGVLDDQVDLKLLDTETDGDELGSTPNKTVVLNSTDSSLKGNHVSLIICSKHVVSNLGMDKTFVDKTYPKA